MFPPFSTKSFTDRLDTEPVTKIAVIASRLLSAPLTFSLVYQLVIGRRYK